MKIFASWSGEDSKAVAELLRDWFPNVLQDVEVYVSSQDIAKGERWLSNISGHLDRISFGIVILTKTNVNAPWVLFEAGALSKHVESSRLAPLLCNVDPMDIGNSPLRQFQFTKVEFDDFSSLVHSVNSARETPLADVRINSALEKWWPDFEEKFRNIEFQDVPTKGKRESDDTNRLGRIENVLEALMADMREVRRQYSRRSPAHYIASGEINTDIDRRISAGEIAANQIKVALNEPRGIGNEELKNAVKRFGNALAVKKKDDSKDG